MKPSSTASPPPTAFQAFGGIARRGQLALPLAVVAPAGRFQHRRRADLGDCRVQFVERADRDERHNWKAVQSERNVFSRSRCCVVNSTLPLGRTGTISAAASADGGGNVLELERHQVDMAGEIANRLEIVVRPRGLRGRPPGRSACRRRARACGRDSPSAGRRWRTSGPVARCPRRRSSRPAKSLASRQLFPQHPLGLLAAEFLAAFRASSGRSGPGCSRPTAPHWSRRPCRWPGSPRERRPASARSTAASRVRCRALDCTGTPSTGSVV